MKHLTTITLASSLLLGACVAELGPADDATDPQASAAAADVTQVAFSALAIDPSAAPDESGVIPFTTDEDYRSFFGPTAPAVDFDRDWVVYFGADNPDGATGKCAQIAAIEFRPSTLRLTVLTRVAAASPTCPAIASATRPFTAVKFAIPDPLPEFFDFDTAPSEGGGGGSTGPGAGCPELRGGALVTIEVGHGNDPEQFAAWVTDGTFIDTAKALLASGAQRNPSFQIVDRAGCDDRWNYSVDPVDAHFGEITIEVCDAMPSYIHDNKAAWLASGQRWCPWGSTVVGVDDRR